MCKSKTETPPQNLPEDHKILVIGKHSARQRMSRLWHKVSFSQMSASDE